MRYLLLAVAVIALTGAGGTCKDSGVTKGSDLIEGEGVIHRGVGPECPNVWHIATPDGRQYWPVENPEFQQDGLAVRFAVREKPGAVSICMAGTIVEVVTLRKR
jgi:hypothetical protein